MYKICILVDLNHMDPIYFDHKNNSGHMWQIWWIIWAHCTSGRMIPSFKAALEAHAGGFSDTRGCLDGVNIQKSYIAVKKNSSEVDGFWS